MTVRMENERRYFTHSGFMGTRGTVRSEKKRKKKKQCKNKRFKRRWVRTRKTKLRDKRAHPSATGARFEMVNGGG
ncbi:hypothetical protein B9Z55_012426 [Caenorhabditis nigoni]|uniref:Uncharacterized protein n=1 Tax=Caenorhabditis nigoni TaxID=1611254 RepID=A0A2G5TX96_9PELO|nr:hypothetical protein B9Z55_012426 [Caenorhabditis nigoni]